MKTPTEDDKFIIETCILSIISGILYIWKGISESFLISTYFYIALNFLYTPLIAILKRKIFCLYQVIYAYALIFIFAFSPSYLYNNYTAFFVTCIVLLIKPHWKIPAITIYFILITVAFAINTENLNHYLIHITRCTYFFTVFHFIIIKRVDRKILKSVTNRDNFLILTDDEINILNQMLEGKKQKEVEGYSINTVTKKIADARTRNNIPTTQELLFRYIEESRIQSKKINL